MALSREYRNFKRLFPPAACPHPVPCSLTTLPLLLESARLPSATRPAGALTGGRDSPRPRAPLPRRASAQRFGDLAGCQQTPSGGGVAQEGVHSLIPSLYFTQSKADVGLPPLVE